MIDRGQFVELTNGLTLAATASTVVTLARPQTLVPALNNNKDHVIEPASRDEFRAGKAIVSIPSLLWTNAAFLTEVAIVRMAEGFAPNSPNFGGSNQGTNVIGVAAVGPTPGALFPTGATGVGEPEVLFSDATGIVGPTPAATTAIGALLANLPIGANQQIRLTFRVPGGAIAPAAPNNIISTLYDTGRHASDYALNS
ncbi:MAG TPA: hypothetical protein EYQ00_02740 [Dehalococcoidia bacterium]|nr:hypothetical protein [Dehalococcoidia bacterium]